MKTAMQAETAMHVQLHVQILLLMYVLTSAHLILLIQRFCKGRHICLYCGELSRMFRARLRSSLVLSVSG